MSPPILRLPASCSPCGHTLRMTRGGLEAGGGRRRYERLPSRVICSAKFMHALLVLRSVGSSDLYVGLHFFSPKKTWDSIMHPMNRTVRASAHGRC